MRRTALILILIAFGLLVAGCGGETVTATPETVEGTLPTTTEAAKGDPAAGKKVFAAAGCAACHTLADAGASGAVGPNLDQSKVPLALITDRVANGKGVMPSFSGQLSAEQIADVAAYVAQATSG